MDIQFTNPTLTMCQQEWNNLDPEMRITMSHFDLAQHTNITDGSPFVTAQQDSTRIPVLLPFSST